MSLSKVKVTPKSKSKLYNYNKIGPVYLACGLLNNYSTPTAEQD